MINPCDLGYSAQTFLCSHPRAKLYIYTHLVMSSSKVVFSFTLLDKLTLFFQVCKENSDIFVKIKMINNFLSFF